MKKIAMVMLLASFSLSTFAVSLPQQDTTKKQPVHKSKTKSKTKKVKFPKPDTSKTDTSHRKPM